MGEEEMGTEQLLAELHALRRQLQTLQAEPSPTAAILEHLGDGVFAVDSSWRLVYLNRRLELMLGCKRADLLGRLLHDACPWLLEGAFAEPIRTALAGQTPVHCEGFYTQAGSWVQAHAYPHRGGLVVQLQDVSARRESEKLLGDQMKELERLNHLKDDFLSTVSHELRTPMANMIMAIQLLKSAPENKRAAYLGILERECQRETSLINDLLDLQELTVKPRRRLSEVIHLGAWLSMLLEPFRSRADQFQQSMSLQVHPDTPRIIADARSLERVASELINNACKYTPAGGAIVVRAEPSEEDGERAWVILSVCNTGEIPLHEQERIFDKFYRIPKSDSWAQGGTGLGLALVRRVVIENLGGEITVVSANGLVTFAVRLPVDGYSTQHRSDKEPLL
jgi:PAS domain S-box-containing protein